MWFDTVFEFYYMLLFFLSVLFHGCVFAFSSCYHCLVARLSVLMFLVLYNMFCLSKLFVFVVTLQQPNAFLLSFLVHCFAFLPCPFCRFAGDFQHYLKGLTNTVLLFLKKIDNCHIGFCVEIFPL